MGLYFMFKGRADGVPFLKVLQKCLKNYYDIKEGTEGQITRKHNGLRLISHKYLVFSEYFRLQKPFPAEYLSLENDLGAQI